MITGLPRLTRSPGLAYDRPRNPAEVRTPTMIRSVRSLRLLAAAIAFAATPPFASALTESQWRCTAGPDGE